MSDYPTPYNGKPYYCVTCGMGFAEYMACSDNDCELESEESAKERQEKSNG